MAQTRTQRNLTYAIGALGLAPLFFMSREIGTGAFEKLAISNADVLGGGSLFCFIMMMLVSPAILVTGTRWFAPLRWWFGVMMFATAAVDFVLASIVTGKDFDGGFFGRISGHTFLAVGTLTVLLLVPLVLTANRRSQKWLGRHWKTVQRVTYAVWLLILVHLALLFGLTGARFLQALAVSVPLLVLRLPPVRRWWKRQKKAHGWHSVELWVAGLLLLAVFGFGFGNLISEEIDKGVMAFSLSVVDD